jgi:hypothetical protein
MILLASCTTDKKVNPLLEDYGYTEVRPPSTLWPPGTIVTIARHAPLVLHPVCAPEDFLGSQLPVKVSISTDNELARKATGTFSLDANYLNRLKASGKYESLEDIKLTFSNVKVLEVFRATIFENLHKRSAGCAKAIQDVIDANEEMSFVTSVLQADVVMKAEFSKEAKLSAEAQVATELNLATQLGYKTSANNSVMGNSLYWGIRDNPRFAWLDTNGNPIKEVDDRSIIKMAALKAAEKTDGTLVAYSTPPELEEENRVYQAELKKGYSTNIFAALTTTGAPERPLSDLHTKNDKIRSFVLANLDDLAADVSKGDGEYIRSLAMLLNISDDSQHVFIREMQDRLIFQD